MHKKTGFTLIELLVTVAIVGILASLAYPIYTGELQKSRRTDAHTSLLELGVRMEHYYTENNSYASATIANLGVEATTPGGNYTLSISAQSQSAYTLSATPIASKPQIDDPCGTLTLTSTNVKSGSESNCW